MTPAPQIVLTPEVLAEMRSVAEKATAFPLKFQTPANAPKAKIAGAFYAAFNPVKCLALLSELESSRRQIEALKAPVTDDEVARVCNSLHAYMRSLRDGNQAYVADVMIEAAALLSRLSGEQKTMEADIREWRAAHDAWFEQSGKMDNARIENERRALKAESDLAALRQDRDRLASTLKIVRTSIETKWPTDIEGTLIGYGDSLLEFIDLGLSSISKETA